MNMNAELIVVNGPSSGHRRVLGTEETLFGRAPASALRLDDPGIAWRHCTVCFQDGQFQVVDLHSGSGTYVNGMRVTRHTLDEGDQIGIGDTVIEFRRQQPAVVQDDAQPTLLRASAMLFLF